MNIEHVRKAVGQRIRLRPSAISISEDGQIAVHDDVWLVEAIVDDEVRISLPRTGHFTHLGKDHIHHYTSNPDESRRARTKHGFFTLNIQIYLRGETLTVTPTHRPGELALPDQVEQRFLPQAPLAVHSPIPPILDSPYVDARELLIAAGWQPFRRHWTFASRPEMQAGNGATFWAKGFHEISEAIPTGLAHCSFRFRDVYGNTLVVRTAGEEDDNLGCHAVVWNWHFDLTKA